MALAVLGLAFQLLAVLSFVPVLLFAFRRSVGTGFLVLCVPVYTLYFAVSQFEHRLKGLVLAGWLGSSVLAIVLRVLAIAGAAPAA